MKWQCAILQRWLPEYPDGDLPAFWRRMLKAHVERCPACHQELRAMQEVVETLKTAPVADPGPQFWSEFSREMHLKLVHAAQAGKMVPARSPWLGRLPYLVGAPALAALLLWVAISYLSPEHPGVTPQPQMAKQEKPAEKMAAKPKAPAAAAPEEATNTVVFAAQNGNEMPPDEDLDDLDSTLANMTDQEKEAFLKKLAQHEKDGSCTKKFSSHFWA